MNIEIVTIEGIETVIIDRGNGNYTSMSRAVYDEQQAQAALSTPIATDEPATKSK